MIIKKEGIDFFNDRGALTIDPEFVINENNDSGWKIYGVIHEDYYEWVNYFKAEHKIYGKVWGDFEDKVFADNEEGYQHFYKHHKPYSWDYQDI